jgi:hypothetical protein
MFLSLSSPMPPAPLRFITSTHVPSSSRESTCSNSAALEMPAPVASAGTRRFVPRARLHVAS